jgi:hypothetical protein
LSMIDMMLLSRSAAKQFAVCCNGLGGTLRRGRLAEDERTALAGRPYTHR